MHYAEDMWIWAEHHEDVWKPARIIEVTERYLKVSFAAGETACISNKQSWTILSIGRFNEDVQNPNVCKDFSKMSSLSTESVLHFLREGYHTNMYYSHLGAGTILAVNPFHEVKGLFSDKKIDSYHAASVSELSNLPAHVFSVAERALRHMLSGMCLTNQSVIISGESGAGKTWTVRCLMRYLALVGMDATKLLSDSDELPLGNDLKLSDSFVGDQIEHRILCSNPILEAFGNAATPRNHNSSRFGKYIQLQYDWCGNIVGARLQVYLLEKTRVATHGKHDKPYHIFSQMINGCTAEEKAEWLLPTSSNPALRDCNNSNNRLTIIQSDDSYDSCSDENDSSFQKSFDKMDGEVAFRKTRKAMLSVGISKYLQNEIFKVLSSILHLQKVLFDGNDDLSTPCTLTNNSQTNGKCAASLLSVPINNLLQAITVREIQAGGSKSRDRRRSVFHRSCTKDECSARREALMKYLYEQVFLWLVRHIGEDLSSSPNQACSFIGLLDVYGFESFQQNGLQQLCINYANEKLQQYYVNNFLRLQQSDASMTSKQLRDRTTALTSDNYAVCIRVLGFDQTQEELAAEGIVWEGLELSHKEGCLIALESTHNSLFAILNEECRLNRPSNALQLKDRIGEQFCGNSHVTKPRISSKTPCFSVVHYAGTVLYETESLIAKNKDELPIEIAHLLKNSSNEFIQQLISKKVRNVLSSQSGNRGKNQVTLLTDFKKSLDDLLNTLSSTNCHYIRCIKPNQHSLPGRFNSFYVVDQLRSCGIVETIQICGQLHPHRISYQLFISLFQFLVRSSCYKTLAFDPTKNYSSIQRACLKILSIIFHQHPHLNTTNCWQFGKTCVFLSSVLFEVLELERSKEMWRCAVVVQRNWKFYRNRRRCRKLRQLQVEERNAAARILQSIWKGILLKRYRAFARKVDFWKRNNAARKIQAAWTSFRRRKEENERAREQALEEETLFSMNAFKVRSVSLQYASVRSAVLEKDLLEQEKKEKSYDWISRPRHNLIERYFPSMMQMNNCRVCCCFTSPFEIISRSILDTKRLRHFHFDSSFSDSLSFNSTDDCLGLPLHSFNLRERNSPLVSPHKPNILPYSDVIPKYNMKKEKKVLIRLEC